MTQLFERNPLCNQDWSDEPASSSLLNRIQASSPQLTHHDVVDSQWREATEIARNKDPVTLMCQSMLRLDEWEVMPLIFKHLKTGLELVVDPGWLTIGFSENSMVRIPLSLWDRWRLIRAVKRLSSAKVSVALVGDSRVCPISALRDSLELHTQEWQVYPDVVANERAGIEIITSEGMLFLRFGMYSRLRFPISVMGRIRLWNAIKRLIREQVCMQFQGLD